MSRLSTIRSNLAGLRWWRQSVRVLAALAAVVVAALVALAIFFALDVAFEKVGFHTSAMQRLVLLVLAGAGVAWAFRQFAAPLLAVEETDLDMALMVERQQKIDSDLVAALQFESPQAKDWGSPQLEKAVVDYVSEWGNGLNVYEGFDRSMLTARAMACVGMVALWLVVALAVPGYVAIFAQRAFLLAGRHYPSAPLIESVKINGREVGQPVDTLTARAESIQQVEDLDRLNAPYGQPLVFEVRTTGDGPAEGLLVLRSNESGHVTQIKLEREKPAVEKPAAKPAADKPAEKPADKAEDKTAPATSAPAVEPSHAAAHADDAPADHAHGKAASAPKVVVFRAVLPRLLDSVSMQLFLSDAWTNESGVTIVPLPVVKPVLDVFPPAYARGGREEEADPSSLQRSVLEGSEVRFSLTSTAKPLVSATFTVITKPENLVIPLVPDFAPGKEVAKGEPVPNTIAWKLPAKNSPLAQVTEPVRFEVQVVDTDGLSLEAPLRGSIRLRADRKPQISAEIVHKVVVPGANPLVGLRLRDDYGIRSIKLALKVVSQKAGEEPVEKDYEVAVPELAVPVAKTENGAGIVPGETGLRRGGTIETKKVALPVRADQLPLAGTFRLPLASYKLQKGDQLKLTFEALDERGELPGEASPSETLVLEVTDISGVLAAIADGDEKSEKGLTDITNLQLGIGAQK